MLNGCLAAQQDGGAVLHSPSSWEAPITSETIGYYSDAAGSQDYLFPCSIAAFRQHTAFPSEGVAAPGWLTGIGWSDH